MGQVVPVCLRRFRGIKTMSRRDLLPAAGPVLPVRHALYRAARDYTGGINALAIHLRRDASDLGKRLSPADPRPLHPELIEDILAETRDPRLLAALVRPAGAVAYVPRPVPATADALQGLGDMLQAKGRFVCSLRDGLADGQWSRGEVEELRYHANQVVAEVLGIVAGAELACEEVERG